MGAQIDEALGAQPWQAVVPGEADPTTYGQVQVALISRDVTGTSTKSVISPSLQAFYDILRTSTALRWVHTHSAGADRPIYPELRARGVIVTTSSGANAPVVAQTALGAVLALARRFPALMAAQREHRWTSLLADAPPPDLAGQSAVVVGWGPAGQRIGELLQVLGLRLTVVRHRDEPAGAGVRTLTYDRLREGLPDAQWLVLVCPLSERTRGLVDAAMLAALPRGAFLVNVARGEVVDEHAVIEALRTGQLGGAHLDVFSHEPLHAHSPLWDLPNVILTPHAAGHSQGNAGRVKQIFIQNLRAWAHGLEMRNRVS
jgi:phosphoglycerate dehydrogenase-like enzyme